MLDDVFLKKESVCLLIMFNQLAY